MLFENNMQVELEHTERNMERAMENMSANTADIGRNIKHINKLSLFKIAGFDTLGDYLSARWDMSLQRGYQLMEFSTIVENISTKVEIVERLPIRESHVRPLSQLESPDHQAEVWRRVTENMNGNGITAKMVQAEVERYKAELARDYITIEEWQAMSDEDKQRMLSPHRSDSKFNETNDNIEWARWSWNPVTGCLHDCDYCYARDIANRFYPQKFTPTYHPNRLTMPVNTKPTVEYGGNKVFVCSMADLFGKWVPEEWISAVLDQARQNPQWTFLFLTKFPIRMAEFEYPSNAWLGTTVDKQWAVERAEKAFRKIKESGFTGTCWLSCEPMLERLTFTSLDMFDWVVMGGASKSTQTPEYLPPFDDIVHLYQQARASGCKVYQKTNLLGERVREYPE